MRLSVGDIMKATGGYLLKETKSKHKISGISTDTRTLKRGNLFIALKGPRYDGHRYLNKALKNGAKVLLVEKKSSAKNISQSPVIVVDNTLKALGDLAHFWRQQFSIPVIAVTGSNGKTTTKDMIAALLSQKYRVLKTEGNFNNLIGLPYTLFRINGRHQYAVVECGMNQKGEMAQLATMAAPQVGVVTNIGSAHLAGLKTLRGVALEKLALYKALPKTGQAVINGDSPYRALFQRYAGCFQSTFGCHGPASVRGRDIYLDGKGGSHVTVVTAKRSFSVYVPVPGRGNVENALAAIAATEKMGLSVRQIQKGLRSFKPTGHRSRLVSLGRHLRLIDDCYNANPDSVRQALTLLVQMGKDTSSVAVLGDMFELGTRSKKEHQVIGTLVAKSKIATLVTIGKCSRDIHKEALKKGLDKNQAFHFSTPKQAYQNKKSWLPQRGVLLVKASRGMQLESIVDSLVKLKKRKQ
jgi:UDP-N-acetylmuramoyl-tripeptide--D-alanyl-D-alanine ligase